MRRITERFLATNEEAAQRIAAQEAAKWPFVYDPSVDVQPVTDRGPYTHVVVVTRWNSCD